MSLPERFNPNFNPSQCRWNFISDNRPRAPKQLYGPVETKRRNPYVSFLKRSSALLAGYIAYKLLIRYLTRENESVPFLKQMIFVPYGVMGTQLSSGSRSMLTIAPPPDEDTAIVDTRCTNLNSRQSLGTSSGHLLKWLGPHNSDADEVSVADSLLDSDQAVYRVYGENKHVIHTRSPDLSTGQYSRHQAIQELARVYRNILHEFSRSPCHILRLPPLSSGISSGKWSNDLPNMTMEALVCAFQQLHKVDKECFVPSSKKLNTAKDCFRY